MSSWFVFGLFCLGVGCWFVVLCVCVVLKTLSFLLSPILQHEGIAIQRQNVFMTVRASSAHDMSSKKTALGRLRDALLRNSCKAGSKTLVSTEVQSVSNRIFETWSKILRISHAMVSARYSASINVKCVAVWIIFPLCASESRLVAGSESSNPQGACQLAC